MDPANPFLQLVPARLPQAVARIRSQVWASVSTVTDISATAPSPAYIEWEAARKSVLKPIGKLPQHYGKLWDQRWYRLRLPEHRGETYLRWEDEAESTLYVDGVPYYGFDDPHRIAPLPKSLGKATGKETGRGTREVWVESIVCRTAIWHPHSDGLSPEGSLLKGAELLTRNDLAWEVLHDMLVLEDLMWQEIRAAFPAQEVNFGPIGVKPQLSILPPLLRRLLRHLDNAINALDGGGLADAKKVLKAAFADLKGNAATPRGILNGHAHIDLVWLWPERVGDRKAVHTFATMNRLFERYPEMRFAYSQPASYEAVERISPALSGVVKKRIKQGSWEAHGATYVESDTLLACGEALARSFLIGQEGFRGLSGKPSPILWLPDVFGYSGCLPQMMKETGVDYFFTTKLAWNAITPFPFTSFRWVGIDGSEVVSYLVNCSGSNQGIPGGGYNQNVFVGELRSGAANHKQCDVHPEFLAPTGFGDGGGGVTEEMCERARRVADIQGVPPAQWGSLSGFFDRLGGLRDKLPIYRGELYFEYHRGTYTTHGEIKAAMRAAERALQVREAVACVTGGGSIGQAAWKRVVFAQFHDYIPGSSIHEVYAEAKPELLGIAKSALDSSAKVLGGKGKKAVGISLFNPLPQPRLHRHAGKCLLLPPLAGAPVETFPAMETGKVTASATRMGNGRVDVRFDTAGRITRLSVDNKALPFTGAANAFMIYPEFPTTFEAWDIDRQALSLGKENHRKATVRVSAKDPLRAEVVFERPLGKSGKVSVHYILEAGSPVLRIDYDLDWKEENALLKTAFPTAFMGRHARFAIPYGSVRRPQLGGDTQAEAMWEVPASRWAVVSDDSESEGFFVVTEDKYGFSCRDGVLAPSLIRSAKITNEDRGHQRGTHPEPIRRTLAPNVCSDIGEHRIRIAIGRFDPAAPREEQPAALAETLFTPVLEYSGGPADCGFLGLEGGESLQPAWVVPGGKDSWTLRLHETLGRSGSCLILLAEGWKATPVDLSGALIGKSGSTIDFRPYQIASLRISRERGNP